MAGKQAFLCFSLPFRHARISRTSGSKPTFFESNLASGPRTLLSAAPAWDLTTDLSISKQPAAASVTAE